MGSTRGAAHRALPAMRHGRWAMGLRRLRPLSVADLAVLPADCPCGGRRLLSTSTTWASAAVQRFGVCGVAAFDGSEPIGWLLVSPALNLPASHPLATGARDAAVAQLLQAHVVEAWRGIGIGRHLVQSLAGRLVACSDAIDALGAVAPLAGAAASGDGSRCLVPPASWLQQVGFAAVEPSGGLPGPMGALGRGTRLAAVDGQRRMRLDLRRTRRWTPDVAGALSRALGWAAPASVPEPGLSRLGD